MDASMWWKAQENEDGTRLAVTYSEEMVTARLVRLRFSGLFSLFGEDRSAPPRRSGISQFQAWK